MHGMQNRLDDKLAEVKAIAAKRLQKAEAADFCKALDQIYANASPEELIGTESEDLYGAALALWKFGAQRKPGTPKLRLYNPRMSEHGWESPHSVLEVFNDDMPFLVDSLTAFLTDESVGIHTLLHPIMSVERDKSGTRTGLAEPGAKNATPESVIQAQVDQIGDEETRDRLEAELRQVLDDVRIAVADWKPILQKLDEVSTTLKNDAPKRIAGTTKEVVAFLDWLAENHFTFLGYREYRVGKGRKASFEVVEGSGLGLLRDPDYTVLRDASGNYAHWSTEMDAFVADDSPLLILKANRRSTVHRTAHFDLIGVKHYDDKGQAIGEHAFIGHFTSAAYNRSPRSIPLLREKVRRSS